MTAQHAISRFRRDATLGIVLKAVMLGAAAAALLAPAFGFYADATAFLLLIGVIWLVLSVRSVQGSRLAATSPSLIASGNYDAAEKQIEDALRAFSLSTKFKLISLHHLAVLRHAQRHFQDSALLCGMLLGQRIPTGNGLRRASSLILADSLLEMNDLPGTHASLLRLYDQRLGLGESLQLLLVQLDYESRIGAWSNMMAGITNKIEMCELMAGDAAAKAQAFLALAAKRIGRMDWSDWLRQRVELMVDVQALCADRPMLKELWA